MEAEVPLSIFTAFVSAPTGASQMAKVVEARQKYDPRHDFYRPMREAVIGSVVVRDPRHVQRAAEEASESRMQHYTRCVRGLERWMEKTSYEIIERPHSELWTSGDLAICVNPEFLMRVGNDELLVKLYLRQDPLTTDGKNAFTYLARATHASASRAEPVLLDLGTGKFQRARPPRRIAAIVAAQATTFMSMWRSTNVA